jgi:hypothetical protein
MRPCSIIVTLCALLFSGASFSSAEERSVPFVTLVSSTTVRGYIDTSRSGHWQRHVCRPVRAARVQRLFQVSTNSVLREIGYIVRCRHGVVYLPNGSVADLLPTPNRSSHFSSHATTPRIDYHSSFVLFEASRIENRLPPGTLFPVPPYRRTNYPPLPPTIVGGGGGVVITFPEPRPPTPLMPTNRPPVIVSPPPIFGGGYSGSIWQRSQVLSEEQRLSRPFPSKLYGAIQESLQRQEYRDVPHGTNLDARWIMLDRRRPISQPPDRFERELR